MMARTMKRRFLSVSAISIAAMAGIAASVGPAAAEPGASLNHNETLVRD